MMISIALVVFAGLVATEAASSSYGLNCYNCEFSLKRSYGNKVEVDHYSGFPRCAGPLPKELYAAKATGVDVWACKTKCYTRYSSYGGVVTRGCYGGETGLNPYRYGCQTAPDGQVYCFCEGSLCNNGRFSSRYAHGGNSNVHGNRGSHHGSNRHQQGYGTTVSYGYGSDNNNAGYGHGSGNRDGYHGDQYGPQVHSNSYGNTNSYGYQDRNANSYGYQDRNANSYGYRDQ